MDVYDLNRDQLAELKALYYADKVGYDLSYEELADIDAYVTDSEIYAEYAGTDFTPDDFFSSAGEEFTEDNRVRVIIDVNDAAYTDFAVRDVLQAIQDGETRGYHQYGQFEIVAR